MLALSNLVRKTAEDLTGSQHKYLLENYYVNPDIHHPRKWSTGAILHTGVPDNSVEIWGQHPQWPGSQVSLSQCFCRYKADTQSLPGDLSRQKSCLIHQKKPFLQKAVLTLRESSLDLISPSVNCDSS